MSESFSLSRLLGTGRFRFPRRGHHPDHSVDQPAGPLSAPKACRSTACAANPAQLVESFWQASNFEDGLIRIAPAEPFAFVAQRASQAVRHFNDHSTDHPHLDAHLSLGELVTRALRQGIARANSHLENGLTFLASIGSTAPFIGLFGTVWGIYHALATIGATGQASLDKVAGPVGEALIMTAAGLFVAIPAVLAYNALSRGLRVVNAELDAFATDLHTYFTTGRAIVNTQGKGQRLTGVK